MLLLLIKDRKEIENIIEKFIEEEENKYRILGATLNRFKIVTLKSGR